jgi:hypothetical protein
LGFSKCYFAQRSHIRWLVKRLIPLNSVGALYGLPNVGKSFVVFANHARRERDWFGRKVKGGNVLYKHEMASTSPNVTMIARLQNVTNALHETQMRKREDLIPQACGSFVLMRAGDLPGDPEWNWYMVLKRFDWLRECPQQIVRWTT